MAIERCFLSVKSLPRGFINFQYGLFRERSQNAFVYVFRIYGIFEVRDQVLRGVLEATGR